MDYKSLIDIEKESQPPYLEGEACPECGCMESGCFEVGCKSDEWVKVDDQ